ncbi:MAG: hypothetical protein WBP81_19080 [Solirubrobacteraceae bacterium]
MGLPVPGSTGVDVVVVVLVVVDVVLGGADATRAGDVLCSEPPQPATSSVTAHARTGAGRRTMTGELERDIKRRDLGAS